MLCWAPSGDREKLPCEDDRQAAVPRHSDPGSDGTKDMKPQLKKLPKSHVFPVRLGPSGGQGGI